MESLNIQFVHLSHLDQLLSEILAKLSLGLKLGEEVCDVLMSRLYVVVRCFSGSCFYSPIHLVLAEATKDKTNTEFLWLQ